MIYKILSCTLLLLMILGCESAYYEKQIQNLKEENARQNAESEAQKKYMEQVTSSVIDIQRNLNLIQLRQQKIAKVSADIERSPQRRDSVLKQNILKSISDIDAYLVENQKALNALEEDLKNSDFTIKNLENLVAELRFTMLQREKEVLLLKQEIRNLNVQITVLQNTVDVLDKVIVQQEKELSKAFYIVDSEDQLEKNGIIEIKGGILGVIGRTIMPSSTFDEAMFNQINMVTTDSIEIRGSKDDIQLITLHEQKAYSLETQSENRSFLIIHNPYQFWRKSKYLIISVN